MNSSLLSGTSYDDTAVQSGGNYFYVSTAVDASNNESAYSNEASAAIP
jgi:fibronectin type 3 domain-containing protein